LGTSVSPCPTDHSSLRKSFKSADLDLSGTLSVSEIRAVLDACHVKVFNPPTPT
jgi:Ca2+-binding EF-hand superfamily protein